LQRGYYVLNQLKSQRTNIFAIAMYIVQCIWCKNTNNQMHGNTEQYFFRKAQRDILQGLSEQIRRTESDNNRLSGVRTLAVIFF
jgi:hypothetical protein